jgi:anti-sigma factor RsiW
MDANDHGTSGESPRCDVATRLSEYLDAELSREEHAAVDAHLRECAACRVILEELRAVTARADALPLRVPAQDLWPQIESRLARIQPQRTGYTITLTLPHLAAAAVLIVALTALVWIGRSRPAEEAGAGTAQAGYVNRAPATALPVRFADEAYDRAISDLQQTLEAGRGRLDPRTVEIVERNLAAIDAAMAQAREALAADPSNTYLNTHLAQARQRKLAVLQRVSAMVNPES